METIIKHAREVGTSAGVILPRNWLNKQVAVTLLSPSFTEIIKEVVVILAEHGLSEEIKGIYLVGSYSRGDQDIDSDVDVLVITSKINKLINQDNYEIILIAEDSFSKDLSTNLNYLSMLKEIKVVMNRELIEKYVDKSTELNLKKLLKENEEILKINKESTEICEKTKKTIPDGIVYSVILRLRELYMIKCLLAGMGYSKYDFVRIAGEGAYSAYIRVKRNKKEFNNVFPVEIKRLLDLSEKWLKELKK
ncbi:MAG: nucleotidyltransferase domain-containing protein [Nanoarchaeota archaeon]